MREDGEDGLAVGGVVDVAAGEELVDELFHLIVAEHLAVGDGDGLGETQGNARGMRNEE